MKTIIRLFAAVLTAVPVLVSCYSEPLPEVTPEVIPEDGDNGSEQDATVRVITVSFDTKATRTEFSEPGDCTTRPKFVGDEEIMVAQADGSVTPQRCTISVKNGVASFETTLQGDLVAVYPADCARIGGYAMGEDGAVWVDNKATGKTIGGVIVPSEQTGKFEDANICMATIPDGSNPCAVFYNQTAVFKIELPDLPNKSAEIQRLVVTSLGRIDNTTGQRGGIRARISNGNEVDADDYSIMLDYMYEEDESPVYYPNPLFVSVLCDTDETIGPVYLADLNFDINYYLNYDEEYDDIYAMGGFSPVFLKKTFGEGFADEVIQKGAIYTGVEVHLHEYTYNAHDYQAYGEIKNNWAIEDLETPGGNFFMWGELEGHRYENSSWTNFENSSGFAIQNLPTLSTSYSKGDVLRLEDDAAYQNWGGAWRMPTYSEWQEVNGNLAGLTTCLSYYTYVEGTEAAQEVDGDEIRYYWSSTYGSKANGENPPTGKVYAFYLSKEGTVELARGSDERPCCNGIRIRPKAENIE